MVVLPPVLARAEARADVVDMIEVVEVGVMLPVVCGRIPR